MFLLIRNSRSTAPVDQVAAIDGLEFFRSLAESMKANPPHAHDYPIVHRMAAIGLRPGESFDPAAMPEVAQETLRRAARDALAYIKETYRGPGRRPSTAGRCSRRVEPMAPII